MQWENHRNAVHLSKEKQAADLFLDDAQAKLDAATTEYRELQKNSEDMKPGHHLAAILTLAVEATFNWYWLGDGLQDHGYHVLLANPAGMQPYSGMKYADAV